MSSGRYGRTGTRSRKERGPRMRGLRTHTSRISALLALVACALLWSTGGLLIKSIDMHPLSIAGGRSLVAALLFLSVHGRPRMSLSPRFLGASASFAGTMLCFVGATKLTTAANAILLQYCAPAFVCLFGWLFFRDRILLRDLFVIALIFAGLSLFFSDALSGDLAGGQLAGNLLAILAGVCFGLQAVLMRSLRDASPESALVAGNLLCFVASIPFLFRETPSLRDLLLLLALGLFQVGLSYLLYAYALRHVTALELILIPIIEPLLNPVWVLLLRGEAPGASALAGGAVVLGSVTLWGIDRYRRSRRDLAAAADDAAEGRTPGGASGASPGGASGTAGGDSEGVAPHPA